MNDQKLLLKAPKSGKEAEIVFMPRRVADRLSACIEEKNIKPGQGIFMKKTGRELLGATCLGSLLVKIALRL